MDKDLFRMVCVLFVVLIILLLFGIRYLRNKENMALIERGMMPPSAQGLSFNRVLVYACIFFGIGIGLLVGYFAGHSFMEDNPVLALLIFACLFVGIGLIIAYRIQEKANKMQ